MSFTLRWIVFVLLVLASVGASAESSVTVEVSGVSGEELDNVMLLLSIEQNKSNQELSDAWIKRLHRKAPEEIKQALEPFGYYRVTVESSLTRQDDGWLASYRIDPGPPIRISALNFQLSGEASKDPAFRELTNPPPLAVGDTFNHTVYEQWKSDLQHLTDERGYIKASFTHHSVKVDLETYKTTVDLQMDSGPRYRFGQVKISGDLLLKESLIRRYIRFYPGEPYSTTKLLQLQEALNGSDYFSRVEIKANREKAEGLQIPITLQLVMKKRTRYQLGLGYGTDTGVRGSVGMERRYVNSYGHRFNADLEVSQIKDTVTANYIIPMKRPTTDRIIVRSAYSRDRTQDIDSAALLLGAGVEQVDGLWHRSYFLNFQREKFDIGLQSGNARLLMPVLAWSRLKSNNVLYTSNGSRVGLELRGARDGVGANTSFAQLHLSSKFIRTFGNGRVLLRGEAGTTWAPEFVRLPPSVRFFAGGDSSVRGYAYKSLGPEDSDSNVIGGKQLLVASTEYEYRLGEKWSAALFFDTGNAFDDYTGKLEQGAGIGLRRRLPIGWLRIDIAQAITKEDRPWRFHISLGPDL